MKIEKKIKSKEDLTASKESFAASKECFAASKECLATSKEGLPASKQGLADLGKAFYAAVMQCLKVGGGLPVKETLPVEEGLKAKQGRTANKEGLKAYVHVDGSALKNPGGPGGWAAVISFKTASAGLDARKQDCELSGNVPSGPSVTNIRMEMLAMIEALKALPDGCDVTMYSDCEFLVKANRRHMDLKKNLDLWSELEAQKARVGYIRWRWEKGHAGNKQNERADALARSEAGKAYRPREALRPRKAKEGLAAKEGLPDFENKGTNPVKKKPPKARTVRDIFYKTGA